LLPDKILRTSDTFSAL